MTPAPFEQVESIADAVMYEGYVLYPYRASAMKNRFRWQFGVVAPRACEKQSGGDPWWTQTECLVEYSQQTRVSVRIRCLHLQRRTVEQPLDPSGGAWRRCERLLVEGRELLTWDEAVPQSITSPDLAIEGLCTSEFAMPFDLASALEQERVRDSNGDTTARITRERWPVSAIVRIGAERAGDFIRIRVRAENVTPSIEYGGEKRELALRQSLLGCHTLLHLTDGHFLSAIDPPPHTVHLVKACVNEHTWPVLAGASRSRDLILSAPIILYDYPTVAPESRDCFFDATEIDEMLALRVMTMAEDEKREASATDARAAAIVARTSDSSDAALHGAVRSFEAFLNPPGPGPAEDFIDVCSVRVSRGSRVRLEPRKRADAMDMFLFGRVATVSAVHRDLEDRVHLAVTIDGDPAADLHEAYGRFFFFSPDEVRPIDAETNADAQC